MGRRYGFSMSNRTILPRAVIPSAEKDRLRVMFLAKHALGSGQPDAVDGNHAIYHHELRTTLEAIGLNVTPANEFSAIERADVDFVFTLLNRAGFQNSEMMAPLMLARRRLPFLGASPIIRGLADDKHLSKLAARLHGVPTAEWTSYRIGRPIGEPTFRAERLVVKPNASSASWGVKIVDDWSSARAHVESLHALGHDVLVEAFKPLLDIAVPVIGGSSPEPWLLPPMAHQPETPGQLRSYEEKRALAPTLVSDPLVAIEDPELVLRLNDQTRTLCQELWPFDYGRFEFRYDPATGDLSFMEVNLSCNLWSRKSISRSAASIGMSHAELVESIVAHSMMRHGLIRSVDMEMAA